MSRKEINRYYYQLRFKDSIFDLFTAPRLALKFNIIYFGLLGIVIAYTISLISSFFVMKFFSGNYHDFHFAGIIPLLLPNRYLPFFANFILFIGYTISICTIMGSSLGIAVRIVEELKGDRDFKISHMRTYIKENIFTIFFLPIGFFLLLFFLMGISGILIMMLKIPVIGKFLMIIVVPLVWLIALVLVLTVAATIVGVMFFPAIVVTWDSDVKAVIFQAFSILWSRPWMLIGGSLISLWNTIISFLGTFFLFSAGFWILKRMFTMVGILNTRVHLPDFTISSLKNFNVYTEFIHLPLLEKFVAFWYVIIVTTAIAYALCTFVASQTLLFIRLKKIENDIDLLKIK